MSDPRPAFDNRITRMLGIDVPIANAPMGGVVGPALVEAMVRAGAMALVPGTIGTNNARQFVETLKAADCKGFGLNVPSSMADESIVDLILEHEIRFVTTSLGPIPGYVARLQAAGVRIFHVVTSLEGALAAADAGMDGLIVEGAEGAGRRGASEVSSLVLLPLITSRVAIPVIAAGGIADGKSMAAAFALGAEGVQMGTRMLASAEATVHPTLKDTLIAADEQSTIMVDRQAGRPMRVLRTPTTMLYQEGGDAFAELRGKVMRLYQEGDMTSGFACAGQVVGRVDGVLSVAEIIQRTSVEFDATLARLSRTYSPDRMPH
jgi:enoyl-[acyl-carrier protein] reductase II